MIMKRISTLLTKNQWVELNRIFVTGLLKNCQRSDSTTKWPKTPATKSNNNTHDLHCINSYHFRRSHCCCINWNPHPHEQLRIAIINHHVHGFAAENHAQLMVQSQCT